MVKLQETISTPCAPGDTVSVSPPHLQISKIYYYFLLVIIHTVEWILLAYDSFWLFSWWRHQQVLDTSHHQLSTHPHPLDTNPWLSATQFVQYANLYAHLYYAHRNPEATRKNTKLKLCNIINNIIPGQTDCAQFIDGIWSIWLRST